MKSYISKILLIAGIIIIILSIITIYKKNHFIKNTIEISSESQNILPLYPKEYIELPSHTHKGYGFTATGITYCNKDNCYYIGNYGKSKKEDKDFHPSIIIFNPTFNFIQDELYFNNHSMDIQGISCDTDGSIWYTNKDCVINYSIKNRTILSSFKIGKFQKYKANGLCIDPDDNSLWVLCMFKYLLHYKKNGQLIETINCDYIGQDHIFVDKNNHIYISAGVDYNNKNNYVLCFRKNPFTLESIYCVNESYAIEGLLVNDSELIVINDGIYHNAKIQKNYIQKYIINTK